MKDLIESPPRTIMEVYRSLPEGTLAELIDGVLYMSPAPKFNHQSVLLRLSRILCDEIIDKGKGEVIVAPFDVYLDEELNAVQPDIVVVLNANDHILDREGSIHGVPDLLVEILSKGNTKHDTEKKLELYERFGVKQYWIIDPKSREVFVYHLVKGKYQKFSEAIGKINSKLLDFTISL